MQASLDGLSGLDDAGRFDAIRALEELVCTASAAQTALAAELADSVEAGHEALGVGRRAESERRASTRPAPDTMNRVPGGAGQAGTEPGTQPIALNLVMPHDALLGTSDDPAHVDGFGPIPAELARELVAGAIDAGDEAWLRRLCAAPTSAANGQGLCQACNHAKQAPRWRARQGPDGTVTTTTPTGHQHRSALPVIATVTRRDVPQLTVDYVLVS